MINNSSVIDKKGDKEYLEKLAERNLFVCGLCKHEKPEKEICVGDLFNVCLSCFDNMAKQPEIIKKACDCMCQKENN